MMKKTDKIYIAGHLGLIGSAIVRKLKEEGYDNFVLRTHKELDLARQKEVESFFEQQCPEYVFLAAAKVGGIYANATYPGEFIYDNLAIQTNIIHSAYLYRVKKLLFFGSACSYPRQCPPPMKEEYLLSGYLEPTNEPYAVAKIAGIKMCQAYNRQYGTNFICPILANAYGCNDHFNSQESHVIPGLIRKFDEAKGKEDVKVTVWGSGKPIREFIFSDDAAAAALFLMHNYNDSEVINIGYGEGVSIRDLAGVIKDVVGYDGEVIFDVSRPDGAPDKLLDSSILHKLGWRARVSLRDGIRKTYDWYLAQRNK